MLAFTGNYTICKCEHYRYVHVYTFYKRIYSKTPLILSNPMRSLNSAPIDASLTRGCIQHIVSNLTART